MLTFDKNLKTLGFVLALAVLAEPSRRRREAEQKRKREDRERKKRADEQQREERRRKAEEERAKQPPSGSTPPAQRWSDEIYDHYREHGYWRGSGGGSWTSSKHPDDWEHMHLK